jgi:hypothetical protein
MEKRNDGSYSCHNEKQEQVLGAKHDTECNRYADGIVDEIKTKYSMLKNADLLQQNMEIQKRLLDQKKRNVTPILKVRLIGIHEKDMQTKISCLLTIWQNATDFSESLKEGTLLQIINLQATVPKTKYESDAAICLSTTRQTQFNDPVKCSPYVTSRESNYKPRKAYEFVQIYKNQFESNEIDTCGLVIYLTSNTYQDVVYLSSYHKTYSILCIWFPKNTNVIYLLFFLIKLSDL